LLIEADRRHTIQQMEKKSYPCDVCDKLFSQSGRLTKHRRIHTGEKSYACAVCDKSFSISSNLTDDGTQTNAQRKRG